MNLLLPLSVFLIAICAAMVCSLGRGKIVKVAYFLNLLATISMIVISSFATEFVVDDLIYISSVKIRYILLFGAFNIIVAFINGYKDELALRISIQSSLLYMGGILLFGAKGLITFYIAYTLIFTVSTIVPSIRNKGYDLTRNYLSELYIGSILLLGIALYLGATESLWLAAMPSKIYVFVISFACFFVVLCFRLGIFPFHLQREAVFNVGGGKIVGINLIGQVMSSIALLLLVSDLYAKVDPLLQKNIFLIISVLLVISAFYGQIKGLFQYKMRSILDANLAAQTSYILVAIFIFSVLEKERIVSLYLVQLMIAITGLKIFLNKVSVEENKVSGLFYRDRIVAISLSILLINLAGLPFTAGFVVRYRILLELANQEQWVLLSMVAASFTFGFIYLVREVARIFSKRKIDSQYQNYVALSGIEKSALVVFSLFILMAGIVPKIFL